MLILLLIAFIAGLVTVLSPCILPILPIVLGSSVNGGKVRPIGVVTGLIVSFSLFTLAASQIVALLHFSPNTLRFIAIAIIAMLGLTLIIPSLNQWFERMVSGLPGMASSQNRPGFWGGALTCASLGLVWSPCAGPILAAVTALAATQQVTATTVAMIVAYAIGAGIPMLGIAYGGRAIVRRSRGLVRYGGRVQQAFGVLMLATALLMFFNLDVEFTVWATTTLAPSWTNTLQSVEQLNAVQSQLATLSGRSAPTATPPANPQLASDDDAPAKAVSYVDPSGPPAPDFAGIDHWINSAPLTIARLRGKVVLVDFWTYSCINCLRTLPYTTSWYNKYKDQGFVVVGVHTPEFAFEHDTTNVEDAVKRLGITYPVAQDNHYATWQAYQNEYWPAEFLIDANGEIRHTHFGEGEYDQTEKAIQQLLMENGATISNTLTEAPVAHFAKDETQETYVGTKRQSHFASPEKIVDGQTQQFTISDTLPINQFAVGGTWNFGPEFATTAGPDAKLRLHFNAKEVYLVMSSDKPLPVNVKLLMPDQKNQTEDLDANANITVSDSRLYHLIHLDAPHEGVVELSFTQPGVQVYAFTFGD